MINYFITTSYIEEKNREFFEEGERRGFFSKSESTVEIVDVEKISLIATDIWEMLDNKEARVILDARKMNNAIATVLLACYMCQNAKTFILLSPEQEKQHAWGYGAGVYEETGKNDYYRILRLWRDIEFFFESKESKTINEPIQKFLDYYWTGKEFKERYDEEWIYFEEIDRMENNKGETMIERLKEMAMKNDMEGFKRELRHINKNENLDYKDYMIIGNLCEDMDLKLYRVVIMEKGNRQWKESIPKLLFALIDAYVDSPNVLHREKARKIVDEYFGIHREKEGKLRIGINPRGVVIEENYIKSLLNVYISLERYQELSEIVEFEDYFIEKTGDKGLHTLFLRNRAICKKEEGNNKEAVRLFRKLYENEATENTLNLIASTYESLHDYDMAARLQLALMLRDYGEVDTIMRLAKTMLENSLLFVGSGKWKKGADITGETIRQVVPLLMFTFYFEKNQNERDVIYDIYKVIKTQQDTKSINFLLENKTKLAYIWNDFKKLARDEQNYNLELVNYIQSEHERIEKNNISIDELIKDVLAI